MDLRLASAPESVDFEPGCSSALTQVFPEHAPITISLDDDLARLAESDVLAGRASSVGAWVADAIRAKARVRTDLVADLEELERWEPTSPQLVTSMARALGLSRATVEKVIKSRRGRPRGRRAV